MRKIKVFFINGIILTASSLLMRTIGMSFSVYISNKVGAETIGVFQLIMSVYMFFITLATSGIKLAATRIISEELASKNQDGVKKSAKQCMTVSLILGLIAGLILVLASKYIAINWLHGKVSYIPLYLLSIALPFMSLQSAINGYFAALRNAVKTASAQVIETLVQIIVTVYLINLFLPAGIESACISLVLGTTLSEIIEGTYLYILYKIEQNKLKYENRKKLDYKGRILNISGPVAITSYIKSGLSTLKQILIPIRLEKAGMSCEQALSQYGIINGMAMPVLMFPSAIITVFGELLIPEFSDYNYTRSNKQINYVINKTFKIAFIFSILVVGIFWTFSDKISMLLYTNLEVSFYLKSMSFLVVLMYLDNIIDNMLKGLNKQVGVMLVNILDLFVTISLIYFLIPISGVYGYIIILFISEILNFCISLGILIKETKFKFDYMNWIIKPTLAIIFAYFSLYLFSINNFAVQAITFIISYFIFLILSSGIEKEDLRF